MHWPRIVHPLIATLFGISVALLGPAALVASAQEATPAAGMEDATPMAGMQEATPVAMAALEVPLIDAEGNAVGLAIFSEFGDEVMVQVLMEGLTPGPHGWHLHETGICDPEGEEPFSSAGGHWNPTDMPHGGPDSPERHVGDFGNFMATDDGLGEVVITTSDFTLGEGPTSVFDDDGTAIIIHAGEDDLTSQPSGDSGARFACGVVAEPMMAMATPMADETEPMAGAATPVS